MKYCLGLDLGVGSIGSAVVELDENNNPKNIADAGVRIFEVSEGAQDRRIKRTARKNLIRTKKRLKLLAKKLFENNLWVSANPEGTNNLKSKSPYKIRYDALMVSWKIKIISGEQFCIWRNIVVPVLFQPLKKWKKKF